MDKASIAFSILLVIVIVSLPAPAHHGTGISYDATKAFMIKGTVTEFRYANPHPQLFWDSVDEKGAVVHWSGEIPSNPSALVKYGWGKNVRSRRFNLEPRSR